MFIWTLHFERPSYTNQVSNSTGSFNGPLCPTLDIAQVPGKTAQHPRPFIGQVYSSEQFIAPVVVRCGRCDSGWSSLCILDLSCGWVCKCCFPRYTPHTTFTSGTSRLRRKDINRVRLWDTPKGQMNGNLLSCTEHVKICQGPEGKEFVYHWLQDYEYMYLLERQSWHVTDRDATRSRVVHQNSLHQANEVVDSPLLLQRFFYWK